MWHGRENGFPAVGFLSPTIIFKETGGTAKKKISQIK